MSGAHLLTYLVDAAVPLDGYPLLCNAVAYWRSNIKQRGPFCTSCRASFADEAIVGKFLFATTCIAPATASVSALCEHAFVICRSTSSRSSQRACCKKTGARFLDAQHCGSRRVQVRAKCAAVEAVRTGKLAFRFADGEWWIWHI